MTPVPHPTSGAPIRALPDDSSRVPYRFTADQVLRMVADGTIPDDEDVELFDGVLYAMTKGELHNCIVGLIDDALRVLIPDGYHVREEKSARLDARSLPEPDVAVCRGSRTDYVPELPTLDRFALVVEVEHHSHQADRVDKLAAYAMAGVPVYWIVAASDRTIEVCSRPLSLRTGSTYGERRTFQEEDSLDVIIDGRECGAIRVADLFPPPREEG